MDERLGTPDVAIREVTRRPRRRRLAGILAATAVSAGLAVTVGLPGDASADPVRDHVADLIMDKADVGDVWAWRDGSNFVVEVESRDGLCFSAVKLVAAPRASAIPQKGGVYNPDKFPYRRSFSPCETSTTFTIPSAGLPAKPTIVAFVTISNTMPVVYSKGSNTMVVETANLPAGRTEADLPFPATGVGRLPWFDAVEVRRSFYATNLEWQWQARSVVGLNEAVTFERTFTSPVAGTARMIVAVDNGHRTYLNGVEVASGNDWTRPQIVDVPVQAGENVLRIEAYNIPSEGAGSLAGIAYEISMGDAPGRSAWAQGVIGANT